jgi:inner membrane protein
MDIVTQGLLGATVAVSGARKAEIRQAAWMGGFAGILADADILIRSGSDPLLNLEFHRHFTHALIFIPLGALIAAGLIWLLTRLFSSTDLSFRRMYYYAFLGYMLSGVLDALTSYGTYLYWPFYDDRIAWSLVSIIDPLFSGILIVALVFAIKRQWTNAPRIGLGLCVFYLAFSYAQSQAAYKAMTALASSRGHEVQRHVVKPTFGNVLLWRTVYLHDEVYYIDAVNTAFNNKIYSGTSVPALVMNDAYPQLDASSQQYRDIQRFDYFSDGFTATSAEQPNLVIDVRYSMIPTSAKPMWGVEVDPEQPDTHAPFVTFRDREPGQYRLFIDMVLGRDT